MSFEDHEKNIRERIDRIDMEMQKIHKVQAEIEYQNYYKKRFFDDMYSLCQREDTRIIDILDQKKYDFDKQLQEDQNEEALGRLMCNKISLERELESLVEEQRKVQYANQIEEEENQESWEII